MAKAQGFHLVNKMSTKEIKLIQGSDEWKLFRKSKIGASDAAAIMGLNPYMNADELLLIKKGLKPEPEINEWMQRGIDLEPVARDQLTKCLKMPLSPKVFQSIDYPWAIASIDAISDGNKTMAEIKCLGPKNHMQTINTKEIPIHYQIQCQFQMFVTGLNSMIYYGYSDYSDIIIEVPRNSDIINKIVIGCEKFYKRMTSEDMLDIPDESYIPLEGQDAVVRQLEWMEANKALKEAVIHEKEARLALLDLTDDGNCEGEFVRITKRSKKGNIDYKKALKAWGMHELDAEEFRKPKIYYTTLEEKK